MNILFITATRLGDAVLSTGLLDHIMGTYPDARITVACGVLPAPLFAGLPKLEKIIVLKKQPMNRHWLSLWQRASGTQWDMIVDLRDSAISRLLPAREKHIYMRHISRTIHKVEQNAAVMGLSRAPDPCLWFTQAQVWEAGTLIPKGDGPVLAVGPTANWDEKMWPADRFGELIGRLTAPDGIFSGARTAIFAAPGEEETAYAVLNTIPEERRINMIARSDPGTAAAALARCDFYIGNDSGLMHCAAATNVPTAGLFGPGQPDVYGPWGHHALTIRSEDETMDGLSVDDVIAAICDFKKKRHV